jgi:ribosomal protein L18
MASEEMLQAITKHAMGDRFEFEVLKERFKEDVYWCADKSVAAALGYLIAKDELEAANEEEEEPDVYDEVVEIIEKYCRPPGPNSTHTTADEIFTLIHEWLDDELVERGYGNYPSYTRDCIKLLFQPFIIEKPEA